MEKDIPGGAAHDRDEARGLRPVRTSRLSPARDVLLAALFLGLCAGLFEVAVIGIRHFLFDRFVMAGAHAVWMVPLGTAIVLLVAALPLALLVLAVPAQVTPRLPAVLLAALACFSMLSVFREIHPYAAALLAAGVALRIGALVSRHPERWRQLMHGGAPAAAALVALLALGNGLRLRLREPGTDQAAAAGTPNILLLILDTVRARNLGAYGYDRATSPHLDSLAAGGVTFELALAPSSWTLPSHASLFTNRFPGQLSSRWRRIFDGSVPTLAEALRERGYHTAGFTANVIFTSRESGLARGFDHYQAYQVTLRQVLLSAPLLQLEVARQLRESTTKRQMVRVALRMDLRRPFEPISDWKTARQVREEFQAWLGNDRRPFFAFLNFFDAHDEIHPVPPFDTMFGGRPGRVDRYDRLVASADHEIGLIVADLARRGELDRTIIAITADHGEHLGEHGLNGHGGSLYLEAIHVPLIIRYPAGVPAGGRVAPAVAMRGLGPTLFDIAGMPAPPEFQNGSLAPLWSGSPPPPEPVYSEVEKMVAGEPRDPALRGPMRSIVDGPWHYIANGDGTQELYDIQRDPAERHNLARQEPETLARLRSLAFAVTSGY